MTLKSVSNLKGSTQVSKQASGRRFPKRPHRTPRNITTSSSHNTNFKNDNGREPFNDPAPKTSKNKTSDSSETLHQGHDVCFSVCGTSHNFCEEIATCFHIENVQDFPAQTGIGQGIEPSTIDFSSLCQRALSHRI